MIFHLHLLRKSNKSSEIPINYQYPLSAAIYKILQKGNAEYSKFLHEIGYGKGYKFFTFSDLKMKYRRNGDRMLIIDDRVELKVHFHLPEASRTFIEGLFKSEEIIIADKKSKAEFQVQSIISLSNPLKEFHDNEITQITTRPISMIIAGEKNKEGNYDYYHPNDPLFGNSLLHNWKNKITACYDQQTSDDSILKVEIEKYNQPYRSRLVSVKADTNAETKIKGFLNFKLKLTAEKRFLELALNAGLGLYSAQGMGCLEVVGK
ncbi:MAG: CRISPR-associated endoribonuclease Cas6 [Chitinophagales bacterium]|nr:CRISPR-associated endoribonuclease Cas6 [Chitinophagales bacterium]